MLRLAQPEQCDAGERPAGQVKGAPCILDRSTLDLSLAIFGRQPGQIVRIDRQVKVLRDDLMGCAVDRDERCPERLMTTDQLAQVPL